MSETRPEPEIPESDEELESLLKGLQPAALDTNLVNHLEQEREKVMASSEVPSSRSVQWKRVLPLSLACLLIMAGVGFFQYGPVLAPQVAIVEEVPLPSKATSPIERFEPISAQGYLINASSEGVVETEDGLRERMNLNYQDAYHWRDPSTGTNIRFFQPRQEELIVPLRTD